MLALGAVYAAVPAVIYVLWLQRRDAERRMRQTMDALTKSESERHELVKNLAALDDELSDAEHLIHEAVVFCDGCCDPVRAGSRYQATREWPASGCPKTVVVCGRCIDDQTDTLTFAAVEA